MVKTVKKAAKAKPAVKAKAKAAPAKKASVKEAPEAKKPPVKFEVGQVLEFKGYANPDTNGKFAPGDRLVLVQKNKDKESGQMEYGCVLESEYDAYKKDSESVDGEILVKGEFKAVAGKAVAKVQEKVDITLVGSMKKLLKGHSAIEVAENLRTEIGEKFFYFGGALAKIYYEQEYVKAGYNDPKNGWDLFCQEKFEFSGRKGLYFASIYQTFSRIPGFDPQRLGSVGWSKAAELARYVTAENVDELITLAENTPIAHLKGELRKKYAENNVTASGKVASRGGSSGSKVTLRFQYHGDQAEFINFALDEAKKHFGVSDDAQALEAIISAWANETLDTKKIERAQKRAKKAA